MGGGEGCEVYAVSNVTVIGPTFFFMRGGGGGGVCDVYPDSPFL